MRSSDLHGTGAVDQVHGRSLVARRGQRLRDGGGDAGPVAERAVHLEAGVLGRDGTDDDDGGAGRREATLVVRRGVRTAECGDARLDPEQRPGVRRVGRVDAGEGGIIGEAARLGAPAHDLGELLRAHALDFVLRERGLTHDLSEQVQRRAQSVTARGERNVQRVPRGPRLQLGAQHLQLPRKCVTVEARRAALQRVSRQPRQALLTGLLRSRTGIEHGAYRDQRQVAVTRVQQRGAVLQARSRYGRELERADRAGLRRLRAVHDHRSAPLRGT
jgi:hypothetical protein